MVEIVKGAKRGGVTGQDSREGCRADDEGSVFRIDADGDLCRLKGERDLRCVFRFREGQATAHGSGDKGGSRDERTERQELATRAQVDRRVIQRPKADTFVKELVAIGDGEGLDV
jgi:hypothetical protein